MNKETESNKKRAVSLKYNSFKDQAPKVTAKGEGWQADKIIALAREHNIPIKEDPDLVQVLSQVDINEEVPSSVYTIVAELLAFVYQINQKYPSRNAPKR